MAAHDVELVRIPFGYWLFREAEGYVGGHEQLDWAMQMAEQYDIRVLLDFHGLPGSQNGNDHSGRGGDMRWFDDANLRRESQAICVEVAERYKNSSALWGFEVINEPHFSWQSQWKLRWYYIAIYWRLARVLPSHIYIVFSDAFRPGLFAGALWRFLRQRVAMDVHWYSFGVDWRKIPTLEQYYKVLRRRARTLSALQKIHPVIVGEWNMRLATEAHEKLAGKSLDEAEREHLRVQRDVYQAALAHIYWSYKTEAPSRWSYRHRAAETLHK